MKLLYLLIFITLWFARTQATLSLETAGYVPRLNNQVINNLINNLLDEFKQTYAHDAKAISSILDQIYQELLYRDKESHLDINRIHPQTNTCLLHYALEHGKTDLFALACRKRCANMQVTEGTGFESRPFFHWLLSQSDTIVQLALQAGANPKSTDPLGQSALHVASCMSGKTDLCRQFIEQYGMLVNDQTHQGATPLHCAAFTASLPTIRLLLQKKARKDITDHPPFLQKTPLGYIQTKLKDCSDPEIKERFSQALRLLQ